ncbi:MAG: SDR family NAD(P)-dependent oxidoreductase [Roseiflexaceae bacterium]|nr:SDR family NAD(P)-dependent oxidoreductase [Roseiflexaceae bacterium]
MQTALIWGSSGGIGAAIADKLRANGWRVLGIARRPRVDDEAEDTFAADMTREADVAAAALWAAQQAGSVQLWVFAVGDMLGAPLAETSLSDWERIFGANVTAAHLAVRHSLALIDAGGHLVFTGAYADKILLPKLGAYAAAKAALDSYVRVLGKELRDKRVTLVRMGAVDTPLWAKAPFRLPRGAHTPQSIAEAILKAHTEGHKGDLDV